MSLLRKLTGKDKREEPQAEVAQTAEWSEAISCPHTALTPRWDSLEDMGKIDRATSFFCQGCERMFTPEEARPYLG